MKKYKLSTQLIILFSSILLFSTLLFSILVVSRLKGIYTTETLDKLKSLVHISKTDWNDESNTEFTMDAYDDMEVAYIRYIPVIVNGRITYPIENTISSSNLSKFIKSQRDMDYILNTLNLNMNASGQYHEQFKDSGEIFFAYEVSEKGNIIVLITNTAYVNHARNSIGVQVTFIFVIVLIFASILIIGWSKTLSNRIFRIKTHVRNLPGSNYQEEYYDDGKDEIGELSRSLETMRIQLNNTENDKREMLQNLSHDFKTPISVIKSYAEAINDGLGDEETANIIMEQAELLQAKVFKLLQYNRLEYLSKDEEFENINMKEVIESVLKTYKLKTDLKIETELDEVYYKGYVENYYTVIDNILDNAKRYAKTTIKIVLNEDYLSIYNDGEQIEEKFINGLFKAYEKGSKGQFGLGMSIVKKTLDFFNYDLEVRNEEVGVTFIIKKKVVQIIHTL